MARYIVGILAAMLALAASAQPVRLPIFDAHLHYNDDARAPYPVAEVLKRLRDAGVTSVLATSRPNDGTRALVEAELASRDAAPRAAAATGVVPQVVPFIRPYRNQADRSTWFNDPSILELIGAELARPVAWRGIGEFHVFGRDADAPLVREIVALAVERGLWLHAHCDDAALERLLAHDRRVKIIWAHSGMTTPPAKVADYLARHPNVVGELSYRYDVSVEGRLAPEWRAVFMRFPERFVVGSDTWVNERWSRYGEIIAFHRGWLAQLPAEVAAAIAHRNGERLFGVRH
jgi:predicted TIM-barrel fold metal-dependent hydrolase